MPIGPSTPGGAAPSGRQPPARRSIQRARCRNTAIRLSVRAGGRTGLMEEAEGWPSHYVGQTWAFCGRWSEKRPVMKIPDVERFCQEVLKLMCPSVDDSINKHSKRFGGLKERTGDEHAKQARCDKKATEAGASPAAVEAGEADRLRIPGELSRQQLGGGAPLPHWRCSLQQSPSARAYRRTLQRAFLHLRARRIMLPLNRWHSALLRVGYALVCSPPILCRGSTASRPAAHCPQLLKTIAVNFR